MKVFLVALVFFLFTGSALADYAALEGVVATPLTETEMVQVQGRISPGLEFLLDNGVWLNLGDGVVAGFWMSDPQEDSFNATINWNTGSDIGSSGVIIVPALF